MTSDRAQDGTPPAQAVLAIHGGAGTLTRAMFTPELERAYRDGLLAALKAGETVLAGGGSALDAVTAAVVSLEDCPLFNAGHGAVLTADATFELDAAVMDGATCRAGAVGGVTTVRNPVRAARVVMAHTPHVLMIGPAAERLAAQHGLAPVTPDYFSTTSRRQQLDEARRRDNAVVLDHDGQHASAAAPIPAPAMTQALATAPATAPTPATVPATGPTPPGPNDNKFGTVGAVALDRYGNLAAATSTGGMTNKKPGRVGDTPLIGAGCYADNRTLAASGTGHGEKFIEIVACYRAAAMMEYGGRSLGDAADAVIHQRMIEHHGRGGLIAIDHAGHIAMPFNTEGMYRGWVRVGQAPVIAIFNEEPEAP